VTLAESEWRAAEALADLVDNRKVQLRAWPDDVLRAAHARARKCWPRSSGRARSRRRCPRLPRRGGKLRRWSAVSAQAYLGARALG
jgi:hypothetical protein